MRIWDGSNTYSYASFYSSVSFPGGSHVEPAGDVCKVIEMGKLCSLSVCLCAVTSGPAGIRSRPPNYFDEPYLVKLPLGSSQHWAGLGVWHHLSWCTARRLWTEIPIRWKPGNLSLEREGGVLCLCPADLFTVASRAIGVHFNIPHQATGFTSPAY